jgi:hypothetical protein
MERVGVGRIRKVLGTGNIQIGKVILASAVGTMIE